MRTADFDFPLPPELIAQHPTTRRDASRLLVLTRLSNQLEHRRFPDFLEYLKPGDVLVLNNSRVIPARLRGVNAKTGGTFEILLLEENVVNDWWAMLKPGKRARIGTQIEIRVPDANSRSEPSPHSAPDCLTATVLETNAEGHRRLRFHGARNIADELTRLGEMPLPPYIRRGTQERQASGSEANDRERYQTVFAQAPGSVAAPTAGLHFTPELLDAIRACGVEVHFVTLHVGLGTFAPVKTETLEAHTMHEERFEITEATARAVNAAKSEGRRVIAVGTTSMRVLESAASGNAQRADSTHDCISASHGRTRIFIHPPFAFRVVNALLTNFHLPRSTLLMLVSAFATPSATQGREMILRAYQAAVRERYRFFSYGDAMFIL